MTLYLKMSGYPIHNGTIDTFIDLSNDVKNIVVFQALKMLFFVICDQSYTFSYKSNAQVTLYKKLQWKKISFKIENIYIKFIFDQKPVVNRASCHL